jgi:hypothetical protein
LVARADLAMNNLYYFIISGDGSFSIGKLVVGKLIVITSWTHSTAITTPGTNRLGILARGANLEFFINGQSVKRLTDTSMTSGNVGVSVEHDGLEVSFSQVRVWGLR